MKSPILSFVLSLLLFTSVLCGCGKKSSSVLPSLAALAPLPNNSIMEIVQNYNQDTLWGNWGEPVRSLAGNSGDIWNLDDTRELMVLYNEYHKVFVVQIK